MVRRQVRLIRKFRIGPSLSNRIESESSDSNSNLEASQVPIVKTLLLLLPVDACCGTLQNCSRHKILRQSKVQTAQIPHNLATRTTSHYKRVRGSHDKLIIGNRMVSEEGLEWRSRQNWRGVISKDLKKIGIGWDEVQKAAEDMRRWWIHVAQCIFDAGWTRNHVYVLMSVVLQPSWLPNPIKVILSYYYNIYSV